MKITINKPVEVEVEVKFLKVDATVRYWQDSYINGTKDYDCEEETNEPQMPCAEYIGEQNRTFRAYDWHWKPIIDIDNGRIINWADGITASIHYKVCDEFSCDFIDDGNNVIYSYEGYVPRCMCPKENGYGDYIIMDIDGNGFIQNWRPELALRILEENED